MLVKCFVTEVDLDQNSRDLLEDLDRANLLDSFDEYLEECYPDGIDIWNLEELLNEPDATANLLGVNVEYDSGSKSYDFY